MSFWNEHELSNLLALLMCLEFFAIGGLVGSIVSSSGKKIPKFIVVDPSKGLEGPTVKQICDKLGCKSIKVSYDFGKTYTKFKANLPNDIKITP